MANFIQNDYYPGGMQMVGRTYLVGNDYRYSINSQEKTPEIAPNTTTAEYWQFDARIVRRWNTDPNPNTSLSVYNCFGGNPIWHSDILGDSIAPGRTQGVNFIIVPTKAMRDQDVADHDGKKLHSAYYVDYMKAKRMERKSKGTLKVIEADNAQDAVSQIKGSLGSNQFVANMTIDFHRSSGPFDDPQFKDGSMEKAFKNLADGFIGQGSNVYLGMCWAGGNATEGYKNLTQSASIWLDGATTYGHQAAASSLSFFFSNHFSGPVWEDYGKTAGNLERRGYHTISYYDPKVRYVRSVELKMKVYIKNSGEIHMKRPVDLSNLPTITPYGETFKIPIPLAPINLDEIALPPINSNNSGHQ